MTAVAAFSNWPRRRGGALLVVWIAAVVGLAINLAVAPQAAAQGWLIAFVFVSGIPIGSLVLLLIHRLTGGRWGEALAPVLMRAAALTPLIALAFVPLAFGLSAPYRWAADTAAIRPALAHYYLNEPAFLLRAAIALIGWSVLSVLVLGERCTRLAAGLGLAFHGLIISLVAVDWILSVDSGFASSAFAAGIAIQQMLSALAFAAIIGPQRQGADSADLAGLILATLLGTVYIGLIAFIVSWYGNLPEKAAWYLARGHNGWEWVMTVAVAAGVLVPFALLLKQDLRRNRVALRVVGSLVLVGVFLHVLWLMAPAFQGEAIIAAILSFFVLAALCIGLADRVATRMRRPVHDR